MPPLHRGQTPNHQRAAGERRRPWRPHHGGVPGLHQGALPAGMLPAARAPQRAPSLEASRGPCSPAPGCFRVPERPLASRRPLRRVRHPNRPGVSRSGGKEHRNPSQRAACSEKLCV